MNNNNIPLLIVITLGFLAVCLTLILTLRPELIPGTAPAVIVVTATPIEMLPIEPATAIPAPVVIEPEVTAPPTLHPPTRAAPIDLLDPASRLIAYAEIATRLQIDGIHLLRLNMELSSAIDLALEGGLGLGRVATGQLEEMLAQHKIQGDYIFDIDVDALAQQRWRVTAFGALGGIISDEHTDELQQDGHELWREEENECIYSALDALDAQLPLGNADADIGVGGQQLNLSDLLTDAMLPLLLARLNDVTEIDDGWTMNRLSGSGNTLEVERSEAVSPQRNLDAVATALLKADLGQLGNYVDPDQILNRLRYLGTEQKAWLDASTLRVQRSQVAGQKGGNISISYRFVDADVNGTLTVQTQTEFEYLSQPMSWSTCK